MATLALLASLLLSWWSYARKRALARRHQADTVPAKLVGYMFEWSASLGVALLFYHVLLGLLSFGWQWLTAARLEQLEEKLAAAQRMAEHYKLTWGMSMVWLLALYALGRVWIRFLDRNTPFRVFSKLKTLLHVVNTLIFLLGSFTLLGFNPGEAAATLEIHLRQERKDYGALRRDIKTALDNVAISRAYDNAKKALPGAGDVTDSVTNSLDQGAKLRDAYDEARRKSPTHDYRIDTLLKRNDNRVALLERTSRAAAKDTAPPAGDETIKLPPTITYNRIAKARSRVDAFKARSRGLLLRALTRPGGKELVLELPAGPIEYFVEALKPIEEAYPVFKPLFDVLTSTLTDAVQARLERKLDDITNTVIEHPESTEMIVPSAAREAADSVPVNVTPETARQLRRETATLQHETNEFRVSAERLQNPARPIEARRREPDRTRSRAETRAARRFTPDAPVESRPEPLFEPRPRPEFEPRSGPGSSPGFGSTGTQCICNTYVNGALVSSVPIPPGASCGGRVCGR